MYQVNKKVPLRLTNLFHLGGQTLVNRESVKRSKYFFLHAGNWLVNVKQGVQRPFSPHMSHVGAWGMDNKQKIFHSFYKTMCPFSNATSLFFFLCLLHWLRNRWKQFNATKYATRPFPTTIFWGKQSHCTMLQKAVRMGTAG